MTSTHLSRYLTARALPLLIAILLFSAPRSGPATTLQRFDLAQLTGNAAQIFVGRCHSATTELESGRVVYTHFVFSVDQMIKGEPAEEVNVHLPGGTFEGIRHTIVGMPTFEPGERVVLFLTADDELGHAWPVGLEQGKFRALADAANENAEPRVFQSLSGGAELLTLSDHAAKPAAEAPVTDGLYLSEFVTLVQGLADAAGPGDRPDER